MCYNSLISGNTRLKHYVLPLTEVYSLANKKGRPAEGSAKPARRFGAALLKIIGTILLIMLTTGMMFACIFAVYVKKNLSPELDVSPENFSMNLSSIIYYKDKQSGEYKELSLMYSDENRTWVDYEDIPKWLEYAAVAIEDKRFYNHSGVDWYRTAGAFGNMFLGMRTPSALPL